MMTDENVNGKHRDVQTDIRSRENREFLAQGVVSLFDRWHIPPEDQAPLLGLPPKTRRTLDRYRKGTPLPNKTDLLNRVGILFSIYIALHQLFPHNPDMADQWVTRPCVTFDGKTPLDFMKRDYVGLKAVRHYLMFELHR
ncbi:MAG: DUF2384 domain-containing protein [Desulfuromonadales bacterium]|nr:MAG: DUF2384 domain-containing protein [Desulfuromonadales bacterium]